MPTNDFKTVADGGSANVLSQAAYAALTSYLSNGFGSGIVPSNQMNKTLRQSSVMSYVLAQFASVQSGLDMLDNGDPATLVAHLTQAVQATAQAANGFYTDTGAANAYVVATVPATTAYVNGQILAFKSTHSNSGAATLDAGAGAISIKRRDGAALQSGDIVANQILLVGYESALTAFVALGTLPSEYLDSPTLRNTPRAPTAAPLTSSTVIATTAYADNAVAAALVESTPQYISANYTAGAFGDLWTDTRGGAFTITLPDPPLANNPLMIRDMGASWDINNLTINAGTKSISWPLGVVVGNLICDFRGENFGLWYDTANTTWRMV